MKRELLELSQFWEHYKKLNYICVYEKTCLEQAIIDSFDLGYEALGLYVKGKLSAYFLYKLHSNKEFALLNYCRLDYEMPRIFEASVYKLAHWFRSNGIKFVNIDSDLGLLFLRASKITLGVTEYYRKYNITPSSGI
jgi:hypothetical protein